MKNNRLNPTDQVMVEIIDSYGTIIATHIAEGYSTIQEAVEDSFAKSMPKEQSILDYTFRVTDRTTGTHNRYRVDAGGKVRLLE